MEAGVIVPRAYILSRAAGPGLVQTALAAFSITPLSCVVIFDMKDLKLAMEFCETERIVKTANETEAIDFAMGSFIGTQMLIGTNMPSLVIGTRDGITAIYEDGRVEDLPWQAQSSMPS